MSNDAFTEWWQLSRTIFCTVRRIVVIPVTLVLFISIYQLCKHNNKMVKSNMATLCWCVCSLHPPQPILRRYKRVSFIAIFFFLSCNAFIAIASKLMTHLICMAHKMPMVLHKNAPVHTTNESYLMIRAQLSSLL